MSIIKQKIIKIAKEMYDRDYIDSIGGNISVKEKDRVFITKTRCSLYKHWEIGEESIVETDLDGKAIKKDEQTLISRECHVHFRILNEIPNINAVLHAHSKYILGFANLNLDLPIVTKFARSLGFPLYIQCIKGQPSITQREAIAVTKYFKYLYKRNPNTAFGCLLPGHGAVVAGKNLEDSFAKLQILENNARSFYFMQIIKNSDYYKEATQREREKTYDTWEDIQNTQIQEKEFYFERENII